jgi:hypothetical protein
MGVKLQRLPDWQSRLSEYVIEHAQEHFRYGVLDCGIFVAGAIASMTGVDVAAGLRGKYSNRREAFRAIAALCGTATIEAVADHLAAQFGIDEIGITFAGRGDVVQLGRGRASKLGLVAMHGTEILVPAANGLLRLPLTAHATRAWRI